MSQSIIRMFEGDPVPEHCLIERILATEEVPHGTGTATRRLLTVLVTDGRYWMTHEEKRSQPLGGAK